MDEFRCNHPNCEAKLKNERWAKTKSGWFLQKDGKAFCPDHIPEWVKNLRKHG